MTWLDLSSEITDMFADLSFVTSESGWSPAPTVIRPPLPGQVACAHEHAGIAA